MLQPGETRPATGTDEATLARLAATEARFRDRARPRERRLRSARDCGIVAASTTAEVQRRLRGLQQSPGSVRDLTVALLERYIQDDDLVHVHFLQRALRACRAVGALSVPGVPATGRTGTAVLVGGDLLLTNNHVLGSAGRAVDATVTFDYQWDEAGTTIGPIRSFGLDPTALFVTDPDLDVTLVAVAGDTSDFGAVRLAPGATVLVGERVNIVQHPADRPKQIALRENQVVDVLDDHLHYVADTAPGSSGAPVFNDQWQLVALHRSGVPATDGEGRYLAVDGEVWDPATGPDRLRWVANEGIRTRAVDAALRAAEAPAPMRDRVLAYL